MGEVVALRDQVPDLPLADNTPDSVKIYRAANLQFREAVWPEPYCRTNHTLLLGDARDLRAVASQSVHLVVTSPPYWSLKKYEGSDGQLGDIEQYDVFLSELKKAWQECERVLVPGGRVCCVVGDVCLPRKRAGRHHVMPLHADIQVQARTIGLDVLTPILWHKIANGATEAQGNGAGFYGKPYQPGAIVKNDIEFVLFMRKPGDYRKVTPLQKALSFLTKDEMQSWWRSIWTDIRGASTKNGHPAPYPPALAERLIRMFSFAGDTVLDPFGGTGSTALGAIAAGRNSVSVEIEQTYFQRACATVSEEARRNRRVGAVHASVTSVGLANPVLAQGAQI